VEDLRDGQVVPGDEPAGELVEHEEVGTQALGADVVLLLGGVVEVREYALGVARGGPDVVALDEGRAGVAVVGVDAELGDDVVSPDDVGAVSFWPGGERGR